MWLEAVLLSTRLARPDGTLVGPLEPFEVTGPLRLGRRGSGADVEWELGRDLVVSPGADGESARFAWEAPPRAVTVAPGGVWSDEGMAGPSFRVLRHRRESCGWPREVAAPLGPWDDALLGVLGDALQDAGWVLGERLVARDPGDDRRWLPLLGLVEPRRLEVTWRRGVVEALALQPALTWAFGRSLARHGVCVPMRRLVLRSDGPSTGDLVRVVAGLLAGGGLPCLESLTCEVGPGGLPRGGLAVLEAELRALPGLAAGFPALRGPRVLERGPGR